MGQGLQREQDLPELLSKSEVADLLLEPQRTSELCLAQVAFLDRDTAEELNGSGHAPIVRA